MTWSRTDDNERCVCAMSVQHVVDAATFDDLLDIEASIAPEQGHDGVSACVARSLCSFVHVGPHHGVLGAVLRAVVRSDDANLIACCEQFVLRPLQRRTRRCGPVDRNHDDP